MKKLLGILILGLLWCNVVFAEQVGFNCKVNHYDIGTISDEDQKRFAGKNIKLLVDTDKMKIFNNSEDSELSVITGIEFLKGIKLNSGIDASVSRVKIDNKTTVEELKDPDEFAEELFLKYKKDFFFIVDGLSRGGDTEVVLSKDYKDLKKGTRITLENVKDFSVREFFNMPIEDKFSKEKSFAESDTPFFRNKLKELKKNFSKRIREYKGYFNKGGEEGIIKKKWGRIFNYYANLDLIDKDSTNEKIVTYYYRGHVYWGGKNLKGVSLEIFDPKVGVWIGKLRPHNIFDGKIKSSARWTYQLTFKCK